eukprot:CAMPEP_0196570580 /NCGR_PEP_ID=MMETSP1081-20130531/722_1 /TAXON_ID=36882 /ORGANISM="Pyramimonas amylifera, Strain CCMP720" /LENGTH=147 /DNA_ID=CAMNT_0041887107 /DNA_START=189 /DNA_END=632 /DNA_ORIENTATION=+
MGGACLEFFLWDYFAPNWKKSQTAAAISNIGLALLVAGEIVRKWGFITAKGSFTHDIKTEKDEHRGILVTSGIYRYIRHPGYLGWFIWSISTQVLLLNPISAVLFAYVSWKFFESRIPYEECLLTRFFGEDYYEYKLKTKTWIPFIP